MLLWAFNGEECCNSGKNFSACIFPALLPIVDDDDDDVLSLQDWGVCIYGCWTSVTCDVWSSGLYGVESDIREINFMERQRHIKEGKYKKKSTKCSIPHHLVL
jgi:hypothetical protein